VADSAVDVLAAKLTPDTFASPAEMNNVDFDQRLTTDLREQLTEILKQEPGLSPEAAMTKITKDMLKNNPFVPPEGDKCPINILPDELLAYVFETGMQMEIAAMECGDVDDDDEFDMSDSEDEEDEEEGDDKDEEIVDTMNGGGEDEEEWSDVDEEEETTRWRKRKGKASGDEDDEGEDDEDEDEVQRELPFQVLVSHVSRRWRNVSLDTPTLWTLLTFEKGTLLEKHKAYVERAKTAPFNIIIDCTSAETDEDMAVLVEEIRDRELMNCLRRSIDRSDPSLPHIFGYPNWHTKPEELGLEGVVTQSSDVDGVSYTLAEFSQILDLLIPHVHQWRALSVSVSDYKWMYLLLARLHQCPPAEVLDTLELYHYDDNDSGETFEPPHLNTYFTPFHGQAPQLRHCVFWGVHLNWEASLSILENVEDLNLSYHTEEVRPSYQTFEAILKSPNLKTLRLLLSGPKGTEDDWRNAGQEPIHLPLLDALTLRYHSPTYARSLLRFIDSPNLKSLNIDFDEEDYTEFAKDLCKAPFGRSKSLLAGLEHFKLSGLPCSRAMVENMLDELRNLKSLNLNCQGEGEQFFETLLKATTSSSSESGSSSAPGKKVYCPTLKEITTAGIEGRQLREFVEGRTKAGAPIERMFMSENDAIDNASERWLKENLKEFALFDPSDSEEEFEEGLPVEIDDDDNEDVFD
jgi:hypothetical protein